MNNWAKIGIPVLIAVLLIISAVSVTIAVTKSDNSQAVAISTPKAVTTQYTAGNYCPGYRANDGNAAPGTENQVNCPGYCSGKDADDNSGAGYGSCHGTGYSGSAGVSRGCCGGFRTN